MQIPEREKPDMPSSETGDYQDPFLVAPVSHIWLARLVEIDSTWNPRAWSERLFERELSHPLARIRGLFINSSLVGYLIAHVVLDEAHIVSLGIDPQWRGRGGGSALLGDFLRYARLDGVRVLTLDVRVSNIAARRLYEGRGFAVAGLRRNYYSDNGEDALTMRRELLRGIETDPAGESLSDNKAQTVYV